MAEQWQAVEGTPNYPFFRFDVKDKEIAGKVIGKREAPSVEPGKLQQVVDLMTKEGAFSIGLTADLRKKFKEINIGALVKIKFVGTQKIAGKPSPMKVFEVQKASA